MDFKDKYKSKTGQGQSLDKYWTSVQQILDMGQSLDKLLRTHIVNQHHIFDPDSIVHALGDTRKYKSTEH